MFTELLHKALYRQWKMEGQLSLEREREGEKKSSSIFHSGFPNKTMYVFFVPCIMPICPAHFTLL